MGEPSNFENSMEGGEPTTDVPSSGQADETMEARLREEMEKLAMEDVKVQKPQVKEESYSAPQEKKPEAKAAMVAPAQKNEFTGKYTIQLFSHQSQEAAQDFADGFIVKGYDVIINEVIIPGKGKWYRVGVGVFENVNVAKDYLEKEKSLFQNQKYIIQQI